LIPNGGLVFHGDHSATHDLVPDKEGQSFSSHGSGRLAIDSRSDPTGALRQHSRTIGPPVTLGDLRTAISDQIRALVVGEIARDRTKIPNSEVAEHLEEMLIVRFPTPSDILTMIGLISAH